jgi:hypothetical protein
MGSKAGIAGADRRDEYIITFRKEENGLYTKLTKKMARDWKTGAIKHLKRNNPIVEEGPYKLTVSSDGFDDKVEYENFEGDLDFLYFKKIASLDKSIKE